MEKIIAAIKRAYNKAFPDHKWVYASVNGDEHRTCTDCGCCHEMEMDGWGSYWVVTKPGIKPSPCAA